eukprot:g27556.t1
MDAQNLMVVKTQPGGLASEYNQSTSSGQAIRMGDRIWKEKEFHIEKKGKSLGLQLAVTEKACCLTVEKISAAGVVQEMRQKEQKDALLGKLAEHYARQKLDMPMGLNAASAFAQDQFAKEEKQNSKVSNSKDRVGNSKFRKMYKAVMRNYSALPWDRVEGQTSWLDPANKTWQELGMCSEESREMLELMAELGVHTPNRLQGLALPEIISGKDVMLTSTTGSGKTLAFLLPLLERFILPLAKTGLSSQKSSLPHHLAPKILSKPRILVVVLALLHTNTLVVTRLKLQAPGRELSQQTTRVILDLLNPFSPMLNVTNLVGKDNHKRQDEALRDRQPVIVVGTPGKLMDHAMEGRLILNELNAVVIDEVDALLSMSRKDHL